MTTSKHLDLHHSHVHQRNICTEGLLGRLTVSIRGRTLFVIHMFIVHCTQLLGLGSYSIYSKWLCPLRVMVHIGLPKQALGWNSSKLKIGCRRKRIAPRLWTGCKCTELPCGCTLLFFSHKLCACMHTLTCTCNQE